MTVLQEQILINLGCVKIKDEKKIFTKPLAKSFNWKGVKTWLEVVNNKKVIFDSKAFKNAHADLYAKFKNKPVEFMYVFTHDLPQDAKEFSEDYKIKNAMIASSKLLELYHNPSLPTIYIGDRSGWLLTRVIKPNSQDLRRISKIVNLLSSF